MTDSERKALSRIVFAARQMLDDDQTFLRVERESTGWYVHYLDYNGWEARRRVTVD